MWKVRKKSPSCIMQNSKHKMFGNQQEKAQNFLLFVPNSIKTKFLMVADIC